MNARKLIIVTKKQILNSLKQQMPDASDEMIEPFVAQICDGNDVLTLDQLLLHAFVNTSLPLAVKEGD